MNISAMGIDIAKNIFQLHGVDEKGKCVFQKKMTRIKLLNYIAQLPKCLIGMEACGGSNYWAKEFQKLGHEVKLISPQFVKPYVKSNKNDANDAEAICEALTRPNMRFVSIKEIEQQDIQAIHRIRSRLIKERTALVNQIRGLLIEYGIVIPQGVQYVRKRLPIILDDANNQLSTLGRKLFNDLFNQLRAIDVNVKEYDKEIKLVCERSEVCKRIMKVEGVGILTATAIVASVGDAKIFKNGREMAAFLGLVPKQYSSGGKQRLLGISKRGDCYLRTLLIHGARAVVTRSKNITSEKMIWVKSLVARRGNNRAIVALANKNARVIWAMMKNGSEYQQVV